MGAGSPLALVIVIRSRPAVSWPSGCRDDHHTVSAKGCAQDLPRVLGSPQRAPCRRFVGRANVARRQCQRQSNNPQLR
jgi:hypothetical protein